MNKMTRLTDTQKIVHPWYFRYARGMNETASPPKTIFHRTRVRIQDFHSRYEERLAVVFFICGFLFDLVMVARIDDLKVIIQQAIYLSIIAIFLLLEIFDAREPIAPPRFLRGLWKYRELIEHFFFGTLLNFYSIFYFKSASLSSSFLFLLILVFLLLANEMPYFRKYGPTLRFALFGLCLCSFFSILFPIVLGFIGLIPFLLACATTGLVFLVFYMFLRSQGIDFEALTHQMLAPVFAVLGIFVLLYAFHFTPPVPLSARYVGVFHGIEKSNGHYVLSYRSPGWEFWRRGDEVFFARPGDKIYFFANIFSPAHFSEQIRVRWLYKDHRLGWQSSDLIPIQISGGREEGYRGYTFKSNYQPGDWRVQLETSDGREIARQAITVLSDTTTDERHFETELR
jgi:hypothetical protein